MVWHRVSFSNPRAWVALSRFILLFLQMRHFFGNMCGRSLVLRASVVEERSIFRGCGAGSVSDSDSSSDDTEAAETSEISQWDFIDYGFLGHFTTSLHIIGLQVGYFILHYGIQKLSNPSKFNFPFPYTPFRFSSRTFCRSILLLHV